MYFGGVRSIKNLIILISCLTVLIPTLLTIRSYHRAGLADDPPGQAGAQVPDGSGTAAAGDGDPVLLTEETFEASLSLDAPSYVSLYPDFVAPQPYSATERRENTVYLTFDDGPSERTDEILQILDEKNVKATFFVIGQSGNGSEKNLDRLRRIAEAGHTVGMHSFSHVYPSLYASVESFLEDFYQNYTQIRETTGIAPTAFRFPGGSINGYDSGIYQELISEMLRRGFLPFDWNVSSEDATGEQITADQIVEHVVQGVNGKVRAFVLFHDSEPKVSTVQALGAVIDRLRAMGYDFEAIGPSTLPVLYSYQDR